MERSIWVGYDPREGNAFAVLRHSIRRHASTPIPIRSVDLYSLRESGLYHRPTTHDKAGRLFDVISGFPMATEFAISRFLVPHLVRQQRRGPTGGDRWALFMDCDMLVTQPIERLFELADDRYAVMVVKHHHNPMSDEKMDGQVQLRYGRKNWSSVMLFNVDHPSNDMLTPELVNEVPGRYLHGFEWLGDEEIGSLPVTWNYLVGHNRPQELGDAEMQPPANIHYTEGIPTMPGYENCDFSGLWHQEQRRWAAKG